MPIKLRPSVKTLNRTTNKYVTEHYFLKCMTANALNEYVDATNSKPKIVQKCRNELTKRRNK
tara:strand:+ start:1295 stop:1480 length:186 start_codon:yes stop_codon:yes gene_type:complete